MLHDIYATSMAGDYLRRCNGEILERGTWRYRGYGNAEIMIEAEGTLEDGARVAVRLHSAERQLDGLTTWVQPSGGERSRELRGEISGRDVAFTLDWGDDPHDGRLSVPDETIFDGPTPVWLIHLLLTAPPPSDRVVTTPLIRFHLPGEKVDEGFLLARSFPGRVECERRDRDGNVLGRFEVEVDDDGAPSRILEQECETVITRRAVALES